MHDPSFRFADPMKSGGAGPVLAIAPEGRCTMGARAGEPRILKMMGKVGVTIAEPFALGIGAVSYAEYNRFCDATGARRPENIFGPESLPITHLDESESIDYCAWLTEETGFVYRLPSETEWEYAARAGTDTIYWWGDDWDPACARAGKQAQKAFVDAKPDPSQHFPGPLPTVSLRGNPWGFHNMLGNTSERCQDVWRETHDGAPTDGSARRGDGVWGVVRGGAWALPTTLASASARSKAMRLDWSPIVGFRVLREL
ncbi:MAG: formylglycine-generating enzyme family protein [Neomegalonema sp.]|nr:formylglycine-generating enzyme family protein [Neomegalonema sp.]